MAAPPRPVPPEVLAALRRGKPLEAMQLLRESSGLGFKEAKDAIDGHASLAKPGNLSPGEVPRSPSAAGWVVAAMIAAAGLYYFLR